MSNVPAGYKFNEFSDVKSHSSVLFNNRLAILFYLLDIESVTMNTTRSPDSIIKVQALIKQIYKNVRSLIRLNPSMRAYMNLVTADPGIYVTDVAEHQIDQMIDWCRYNRDGLGWTEKRVAIIIDNLNSLEMMIKDCLQYFSYFIRADFKQKPDLDVATERFKSMIGERTADELRSLLGKRHKIDLDEIGLVNIASPTRVLNDDEEDTDEEYDDEESTEEAGPLNLDGTQAKS